MAENLPFSLEAEQGLIGSMMINSNIIAHVSNYIEISDFYLSKHKEIYSAIIRAENKDLVSIWDLIDTNKVDKKYYMSLCEITTSAAWKHYVEIIKNYSKKRLLHDKCVDIAQKSYCSDVNELLSELKTGIYGIEKDGTRDVETNQKLYTRVYNQIYEQAAPGIYTGIDGLEQRFWFEPGYIHCVAAESGVGKSALMLQVADYIAATYGKVLYFSLESTRERLGRRQLARHAHIALTRINKNNFTGPDQEEKIQISIGELCESKLIFFDDAKYYEIERLTSFCESEVLRNNVAAIFVDYLQAAQSVKRNLSKKDRVENALYQLKRLAKNIDIPIIYASQLRKDIQGRPSLDDLYESNEIRQATDNILFMYTPVPRKDRPSKYPVELYLEKGKDQELFSVWQEFNGNFQSFVWCEEPKNIKTVNKNWQDNI